MPGFEVPTSCPAALDDPKEQLEADEHDPQVSRSSRAPSSSFSPLDEACRLWHRIMPDSVCLAWLRGLRAFVEKFGGKVSFATAFAGTDMTVKVLKYLSAAYKLEYDIDLKFEHVWTSEMDVEKQEFIQNQVSPPALFPDFGDLSNSVAFDAVSGKPIVIPYADILFGGFPCQSKSSLNKNKSLNAACIQDGTGTTGRGFASLLSYLDAAEPKAFFLENVPGVRGNVEEEFIVQQLETRGYYVHIVVIQAANFGSAADRMRWFCFGCKRPDSLSAEAVAVLSSSAHQYLMSMRIDPYPIEEFIMEETCQLAAIREEFGFLAIEERPDKMLKADPKNKDEHFELFRSRGFVWPPEIPSMLEGFEMDFSGLKPRQAELVIFCHRVFPPLTRFSFIDVNPSLGLLVGYKDEAAASLKDPWRDHPATIVGSSLLVVRINTADVKVVRPLEGWEYLSLIGWGLPDWNKKTKAPSAQLCGNLAGNAFSAFAIGPFASVAFSIVGQALSFRETCNESQSSSSASANCGTP